MGVVGAVFAAGVSEGCDGVREGERCKGVGGLEEGEKGRGKV